MQLIRLLTSRKFAAGLMVALVLALLLSLALAGAIPGISNTTEDQATAPPGVPPRMPRPYGYPLVLLLSGLTVVALTSATARQSLVAWKRTAGSHTPRAGSGSTCEGDTVDLGKWLRARGWIRLPSADPDVLRFVRNPWSIWTGVILHVGLIVIILAATTVIVTGRRATVSVQLGDEIGPRTPVIAEVHGPLATQLSVPGTLQFVDLRVDYAPNRDLRQIATTLLDPSSGELLSVAVNQILSWRGTRVYQSQEFGPAYTVEFTREGETIGSETIEMLASSPADVPTYRDIPLPWGPELLRVRSVVTTDGAPHLTLRLEQGDAVVGETALEVGRQVVLGAYGVTLESITWWDRLIFVQERGVPFLFLGFLLAGLAGLLMYAAPVREIYVRKNANTAEIVYRASKFPGAEDERQRVLAQVNPSREVDA